VTAGPTVARGRTRTTRGGGRRRRDEARAAAAASASGYSLFIILLLLAIALVLATGPGFERDGRRAPDAHRAAAKAEDAVEIEAAMPGVDARGSASARSRSDEPRRGSPRAEPRIKRVERAQLCVIDELPKT